MVTASKPSSTFTSRRWKGCCFDRHHSQQQHRPTSQAASRCCSRRRFPLSRRRRIIRNIIWLVGLVGIGTLLLVSTSSMLLSSSRHDYIIQSPPTTQSSTNDLEQPTRQRQTGRSTNSTDTNTADVAKTLIGFKTERRRRHEPEQQRQSSHNHQHPPNYHIVFSTGCDQQQEWESYVFFYHAMRVQQRGNVTRIASGCVGPLKKHIKYNHEKYIQNTMSQNFHIHFTPEYAHYNGNNKPKRDEAYKYMNKPHGLYHWMTNVLGMKKSSSPTSEEADAMNGTTTLSERPSAPIRYSQYDDDILILMDPDMILLRPIGHDFTNHDDTTIYTVHPDQQRKLETKRSSKHRPPKLSKYVTHNKAIAQHDGYLNSEWMKFNISYITNGGKLPPYLRLLLDGENYWNAGPPYMATVRDMFRITTLWKEYVPKIYEEYPKLFAEMYGYIIASTQTNVETLTLTTTTTTQQRQIQQQQSQAPPSPPRISHTLIKSLVVSTTKAIDREGWRFIDDKTNLPNSQVCNTSLVFDSYKHRSNDNNNNDIKLPIILHYCGRYLLGDKWFFSKYRLKKRFISCETPLLTYPPLDSATKYDYWIRPPPDAGYTHEFETENITKVQAKREAFMLCGLIHGMNEAAKYYKSHHCNNTSTTNWNETYDFHSDPNSTRR